MMTTDIDYYELLECERGADDNTLKSAYRRLAIKWHPDKNPGDAAAEARFKAISEAYECGIRRSAPPTTATARPAFRAAEQAAGLRRLLRHLRGHLWPVHRARTPAIGPRAGPALRP